MKKLLPGAMIVIVLGLLLIGMAFKDSLNVYIAESTRPKYLTAIRNPVEVFIDSAFNYTKNNSDYQLTFLEFGSTTCSSCKKMESVMQQVQENYPGKVNVVFYNVNLKENYKISEQFDIQMIPVQVLLDKNGKECYRHVGYLSFNELLDEMNKYLKNRKLN